MNGESSVDVVRLIRVLTICGSLVAAVIAYLVTEPSLVAANARLERAREVVRGDDDAFREAAGVRFDRDRLARRYAMAFGKTVEAEFVRAIDADARRHRIRVLETTTERHARGVEQGATSSTADALARVDVALGLRGGYRDLLACIADLSRADALVGVRTASLRRDDGGIVASVRLTLFEPEMTESPGSPTIGGLK